MLPSCSGKYQWLPVNFQHRKLKLFIGVLLFAISRGVVSIRSNVEQVNELLTGFCLLSLITPVSNYETRSHFYDEGFLEKLIKTELGSVPEAMDFYQVNGYHASPFTKSVAIQLIFCIVVPLWH